MSLSTDTLSAPTLRTIEHLQIGDLIRRLPHHFHGQYVPSIHAARVERFSRNGIWARTGPPDSKLYHVSDVALEEGHWQPIPNN